MTDNIKTSPKSKQYSQSIALNFPDTFILVYVLTWKNIKWYGCPSNGITAEKGRLLK